MLIGNDCLVAFLYKRYNKTFDNPFMWTVILDCEFLKLCNLYKELNFTNISIYPIHTSKLYNIYKSTYKIVDKFDGVQYCMLIDNTVEIAFLHYIENPNYTEKTKIKSEVYYNDCKTLITLNYFKRYKRMNINKIKFVYNCTQTINNTINDIIHIPNIIVFSVDTHDETNFIKKNIITERVRLLANRMPADYYNIFFK